MSSIRKQTGKKLRHFLWVCLVISLTNTFLSTRVIDSHSRPDSSTLPLNFERVSISNLSFDLAGNWVILESGEIMLLKPAIKTIAEEARLKIGPGQTTPTNIKN